VRVKWFLITITVFTFALLACESANKAKVKASPAKAPKATVEKHPELSPQEKLIACSQCHMQATPDIYKEWFNSVHGIANVKCFQCHGTFENFHVTPEMKKCEACHAREVAHSPKGMSCWSCHPEHKFTVHR